eukprot:6192258-Pleurochrysis_carterae.AAC.5
MITVVSGAAQIARHLDAFIDGERSRASAPSRPFLESLQARRRPCSAVRARRACVRALAVRELVCGRWACS